MTRLKITPEETYQDWIDDLCRQAAYFKCGLSADTDYDGPFAIMCFREREEAERYKKMIEQYYGYEVEET